MAERSAGGCAPPAAPDPYARAGGAFSWADPTRVHRILESAGFREVSLTPVDPVIRLASTGEAAEAADFVMVLGPLTRVLPALSAPQRETVRAALEAYFQKFTTLQGVFLPAANWVVQARV